MKTILSGITFSLIISGLLAMNLKAEDSLSQGSGKVKLDAIKEELELEKVNIKLVGGSEDVMLEGTVSDPELSKCAEEIATQYFSKVFNILSVEKPYFSYQFSVAEYSPPKEDTLGSKYMDILKEGALSNSTWHVLLFDQKEMDNFKRDLTEIGGAAFLDTAASRVQDNAYCVNFTVKDLTKYGITINASSMDNGFLKCLIKITGISDTAETGIYEKDIYCKTGEWVVVSGFSSLAPFKSSRKDVSSQNDIILFFQAAVLPEAV